MPYRSRPDERPAYAGMTATDQPHLWIADQVRNDGVGSK